ncbi:MAG TPA: hypothetical protein DER04_06385, partial [Holosporales bacterium]|nr:hypothetical protein [Holosporales bacterium]
ESAKRESGIQKIIKFRTNLPSEDLFSLSTLTSKLYSIFLTCHNINIRYHSSSILISLDPRLALRALEDDANWLILYVYAFELHKTSRVAPIF